MLQAHLDIINAYTERLHSGFAPCVHELAPQLQPDYVEDVIQREYGVRQARSTASRLRAAAWTLAGPNLMQHHYAQPQDAEDVLFSFADPAYLKYRAGLCLRLARYTRLSGGNAAADLHRAAQYRRRALPCFECGGV